mmetsp:Transcript_19755/g.44866  ORF Transcript_19755/g.44866 Transcript_19755/m.44866 type:complete len:88 (+) Transcript_19755:1163-1426(+)
MVRSHRLLRRLLPDTSRKYIHPCLSGATAVSLMPEEGRLTSILHGEDHSHSDGAVMSAGDIVLHLVLLYAHAHVYVFMSERRRKGKK